MLSNYIFRMKTNKMAGTGVTYMAEEASEILFQWCDTDDEESESEFESSSGSEVLKTRQNVSSLSKTNEKSDFELTLLPPNQAAEDDIYDEP